MISRARKRIVPLTLGLATAIAVTGCGGSRSSSPDRSGAPKIRFQTDWYPQAEHGGFYQALARGFYAEAGLDVEILPGGPGLAATQKLAGGIADVGMGRSDDITVAVQTGLPFLILAPFMQHDPQGILVHEESNVKTFKDLDGSTMMAAPGSGWIEYLKARYRIHFDLMPLNYGIGQFMADKTFIQQCFVTNEPFYVRKNGANPRTLLIAGSGYDPYRVMFTTKRFAREHPDALRAFVAASIRGWRDFMGGDPAPAKALIAERNDQMSPEFMDFSIASMKENRIVGDLEPGPESIGTMSRERLEQQTALLTDLKILKAPPPLDEFVAFDLLPKDAAGGQQ